VAAPHAVDHGRIRTPHSHVRGMPATQKLNTPPAVYECLRTEGMSEISRGTVMSDGMIQSINQSNIYLCIMNKLRNEVERLVYKCTVALRSGHLS